MLARSPPTTRSRELLNEHRIAQMSDVVELEHAADIRLQSGAKGADGHDFTTNATSRRCPIPATRCSRDQIDQRSSYDRLGAIAADDQRRSKYRELIVPPGELPLGSASSGEIGVVDVGWGAGRRYVYKSIDVRAVCLLGDHVSRTLPERVSILVSSARRVVEAPQAHDHGFRTLEFVTPCIC